MKSPTVSVVVATYNYAHYLPYALESLFAQTFTDWEANIVDDGSTDDTPQVVQRYLHDERVHYHRTSNAGQPAAENCGIRRAVGELIAFLDADDVWYPEKLARQLDQFQRTPDAGVVYGRSTTIDPHGQPLNTPVGQCFRGHVLKQMFRDNFVCFSSSIVRKEVFEDVGLFNEAYRHASDYDLWLRAAIRWKFEFVDAPLVYYRTGHANLTSRGDTQLLTALQIMERFVDSNGHLIPDELKNQCFMETYCHLALAYRQDAPLRALRSYLAALRFNPYCYEVWRGLAALCLPESARSFARHVVGRRDDLRMRQSPSCVEHDGSGAI